MRNLGLAVIIAVSSIVASGQAMAQSHNRDWRPSHSHKQICRIEHQKVKFHGRWTVKTVKICR